MFKSLGLMSGTSMDGIDATIIETDGISKIREIGFTSFTYEPDVHLLLKSAEYTVNLFKGDIKAIESANSIEKYISEFLVKLLSLDEQAVETKLNTFRQILDQNSFETGLEITFDLIVDLSTRAHAKVVNKLLKQLQLSPENVDVIGYHGQTLYHSPERRITVQSGYGDLLAKLTGIKVVNDFRSKDVSVGGQGAPLQPLYHQALAIRDNRFPLAVVNCGGIANISVVNGPTEYDVVGFDTGPGNGLVDLFVKTRTAGKKFLDKDAEFGSEGEVHEDLIKKLYVQCIIKAGRNYFDIKPPKSLDIKDMKIIKDFEELSIEDGCATLEAFTADAVVSSLNHITICSPKEWVLVGGGWNNPVIRKQLIARLRKRLGDDVKVFTASEVGWNNDSLEAQIFAFFAVRHLLKLPVSYPGITGVDKPMTAGVLHLP